MEKWQLIVLPVPGTHLIQRGRSTLFTGAIIGFTLTRALVPHTKASVIGFRTRFRDGQNLRWWKAVPAQQENE